MPRLSLYRPEKTRDFEFMDRTVYEMFQVGGVDILVHKYTGTDDGTTVKDHTQIQDLLFLENRDRVYDPDLYTLRGVYNVSDIDFNLSQFGLFLSNDTLFMTIHIRNSIDILGRKIMAGDVVELPNLIDEYAENTYAQALKRFYVVEDVTRAAEGFSTTWYPHLYRVKLKSIMDTQEYSDILSRPAEEETFAGNWEVGKSYYVGQTVKHGGVLYDVIQNCTGIEPPDFLYYSVSTADTLRDIMSTYNKELGINDAVISEAENDAPTSGYDTSSYYTAAVDPASGDILMNTVNSGGNVSGAGLVNDMPTPAREGYTGYLLEDGFPPNGPTPNLSDVWSNADTYYQGQTVVRQGDLYTALATVTGSDPITDTTNWKKNSQFGFGIQFPINPATGDFFLRTDFLPNRTFKFDGTRWVKQEDNVQMTMTNTDTRGTQKTSFINNSELSGINRIATDVVQLDEFGAPAFEAGTATTSFAKVSDTEYYIITNVAYSNKYAVEAWLNEDSKATNITASNDGGFVAITINHKILAETKIRYSVFEKAVKQRQSLSKALRPEADN
jgi:hypothetical protein